MNELESPPVLMSPDTITIDQLKELAQLVENFLIVSNFLDGFLKAQEKNVNLSVIVSGMIFKNDDSYNSFCKISEYLTGQRVNTFSGKELVELFNYTVDFLAEIELIGFFLKAGTALLTLIKD